MTLYRSFIVMLLTACPTSSDKTDGADAPTGSTDGSDATDSAATDATDATNGDSGNQTDAPLVYVNEVLPFNETTNQDESGDFDDWFELYNPGTAPIDISGWTASDDGGTFTFPKGSTIPAGGHLLVWADDEVKEGPLHAPFTLSSGGDGVTLSDSQGELVDELSWFSPVERKADVSYGRSPDGSSTLMDFSTPTPGAANP